MKPLLLSLALGLAPLAATADAAPRSAPACPATMTFTKQKTALMDELRETRNAQTGLFLTRRLVSLWSVAPNWQAQELLDTAIRLRQRRDFPAAEAALDRLIAYCPTFAEGYHQRALLWRATGDFHQALADLDTALDLAPDHPGAMARKAQVLAALGRFKDGHALRAEVLERNPWLPDRFTDLSGPGLDV